jgi:hypothetical protein
MSVNKEFRVRRLNAIGMAKAVSLAALFDKLLTEVLATIESNPANSGPTIADPTRTYSGREIALVRTHLELASFYAKKAMAQLPENTEGA